MLISALTLLFPLKPAESSRWCPAVCAVGQASLTGAAGNATPPAPEVPEQPSSMKLLLLGVARGICKMGCRQQQQHPLLEGLVGLEKLVPGPSDVVVEHRLHTRVLPIHIVFSSS